MLGSRTSSSASSSSKNGRRYRTSGYPPPSSFSSLMGFNNGGHHQHHSGAHHSSSSPSTSPLDSSLSHHKAAETKIAASSSNMSDANSELSETPTRKRIAVACGRCRRRKIRCSGDAGGGQPCINCRTAGNEPCQFLRVQSTLAPIRHDNDGNNSTAPNPHQECGYNIEASRATAHRGSMPPLPMPSYAVDLSADVTYHTRPSYSSAYSSRPAAVTASPSYYTTGSGGWSGYSTDEDYQAAGTYYHSTMADMSGYSPWGSSGGGSTSGTRTSSRSGPAAGSMYVNPPAPAQTPVHAHLPVPSSSIVPQALNPHHHSSLVHRPAIPTSGVAIPATVPVPASAPIAAVVGAGHQGQPIPQNFLPIPYPYSVTAATAVVGQSCGIVYMPQPTPLRLGSNRFISDELPSERLSTSPSSSDSPHAQLTAAAPATPFSSVQAMVKVETTASPSATSNRASTSPACSSTTQRTSIGSIGGHKEQKGHDDEFKRDEELQQHKLDQKLKPLIANSNDMPEVANLPDAIFSDSLHGPSMGSYDYADASASPAYNNTTSTTGSSSGSGVGGNRRSISSMANGQSYVPLPTPPPPNTHHHPHHSHHAPVASSHSSSYAHHPHYQSPSYHQHGQHVSPAEHHHYAADHHRSSMGHRR